MTRGSVARTKTVGVEVPWYRTPSAVAERKERSRRALLDDGGRELRQVRLDSEANEAFKIVQAAYPEFDNGEIVRLAVVKLARSIRRRRGGE